MLCTSAQIVGPRCDGKGEVERGPTALRHYISACKIVDHRVIHVLTRIATLRTHYPWIGRDLAGFRQPDHVHGRRVAGFVARTTQSHLILKQGRADIPLPRIRHAFLDFMCDRAASMQSNRAKTMPTAKARACSILAEFDHAQTELVGKAVILTDGIAGTVDQIWLDELHGLRISVRGHEGKWPVSTIKLAQTD